MPLILGLSTNSSNANIIQQKGNGQEQQQSHGQEEQQGDRLLQSSKVTDCIAMDRSSCRVMDSYSSRVMDRNSSRVMEQSSRRVMEQSSRRVMDMSSRVMDQSSRAMGRSSCRVRERGRWAEEESVVEVIVIDQCLAELSLLFPSCQFSVPSLQLHQSHQPLTSRNSPSSPELCYRPNNILTLLSTAFSYSFLNK